MNHTVMVITQTHHALHIARVPYGVITTLLPDIAVFIVAAKHHIRCASIDSIRHRIVYLHRRHSITIHLKQTVICQVTIMKCKRDTIALHRRCTQRYGRHQRVDANRHHRHHCSVVFDVSMIPTTITIQIEGMYIRQPDHSMVVQDHRVALMMPIIHHHKYIMCMRLVVVEVYAKSIWIQMQIHQKNTCTQRRRHHVVKIHRHRGLDRTQILNTLPKVHRIHTVEKVQEASSKTIKLSPTNRIYPNRKSLKSYHHITYHNPTNIYTKFHVKHFLRRTQFIIPLQKYNKQKNIS